MFGRRLLVVGLLLLPLAALADPPEAKWDFDPAELKPFWRETVMQGESVLFIQVAGGEAKGRLLFAPTKILKVTNSHRDVTYEAGKDYLWKPGSAEIVLPPGSRIVSKSPRDLRRPAKSQKYALTHRDGNGEILFGATHEYHDMQTLVTYEHDGAAWKGPAATLAAKELPRTLQKLKDKQPLKIALLGDSISTGCNASGWAKVAPHQPPYQDLFVLNLKTA
ncbi:MAG TPA: hypothetical protein VFW62_06470, partial [bacterium]|nr:hypothetical protein [bacterium]